MTDVLSQSEVESLLSALDPGGAPVADSSSRPERNAQITIYDFKRPERVSKEQMRALQALHDGFSREFGAGLSAMLRTICEVKLISVDQLTYSEFVFSVENPTCFNLVESRGLDGHFILDLNPSIVFPIVDRLLGGGKESAGQALPHRPLTEIEVRLASRVTDIAMRALENAWHNICDLGLTVAQVESNPQLVQIVPPNEVVVLVSFEITMGEVRGILNLCLPFNTIETHASKLTSDSWVSYKRRPLDEQQRMHLESGMSRASVELSVQLASTSLTTADAMNLEVGDIILTEQDITSGAQILVAGRPVFTGFPGVLKGQKAIRVARQLEPPKQAIARHLGDAAVPESAGQIEASATD
ncbi:MAG: flagellar motor switch protein FliM [Planctomycetota bacterium]|jgi:flagellar motor switch protein FliM